MTTVAPSYTDLTGTYILDPTHTRIGFVARHAMVTKVRGSFNEFEGTAAIDGNNPADSSVRVTIDAASIDTRNAQRDAHLRSNDFLSLTSTPGSPSSPPASWRSTSRRSSSPAT
jgi:polyisoprenoid-binding protein YceI